MGENEYRCDEYLALAFALSEDPVTLENLRSHLSECETCAKRIAAVPRIGFYPELIESDEWAEYERMGENGI